MVNQANLSFGENQIGAAIQIVVVRSIAGLFAHAFFSAIFGAGLVYLVGTAVTHTQIGRGLGLIVVAMIVHGSWDGMAAIAGVTGLNMFVAMGAGDAARPRDHPDRGPPRVGNGPRLDARPDGAGSRARNDH